MNPANRDEAFKCLEVAEAALARGDLAKAERFALKAQKLFPTDKGRLLLTRVKRSAEPASSSDSGATAANGRHHASRGQGAPAGMGSGPNLRQRQAPASGAGGSSSSSRQQQEPPDEDHKATPEQRELVRRIRATTCYYEILSVSRTASDDDIKRAYRKLALRLHPDKNKARGADEAFKAVSKAFTCLSDPAKRRHYDAYGREEPAAGGARRGGPAGGGAGGFYGPGGAELDPEELFNMFFGGNPFMGGGVYRTAGFGAANPFFARAHAARQGGARQQGAASPAASPMLQLVQLLPLLLLLVFTFLSGRSQPLYSLHRTRQYASQLATSTYEVPFWAKDAAALAKDYPPGSRARMRLEQQIESEYRAALQQQCYNERMLQQRYHYYGRREEAQRMELKSCDELTRRFGSRSAGPAAAGGGTAARAG